MLKLKKYCARTVKDTAKEIRLYRRNITQNYTFCYNYRKQLTSTLNPYIATEHTLLVSPLHILLAMSLYILLVAPLAFVNISLQKINTSYNLTLYKANLKSVLDGNLPA